MFHKNNQHLILFRFSTFKSSYVLDKKLGDVRLKIDPKIGIHFFNNKSKFVFLRKIVIIF